MSRRAVPVRTCVGCRERAAKSELLRVVAVGGVLVPDPRGRLPGRGAHLHLDPVCLDLAERRRAFGRALRTSGPLDLARVREHLTQHAGRPTGRPDVDQSSGPERPEAGRDSDERSMSMQR